MHRSKMCVARSLIGHVFPLFAACALLQPHSSNAQADPSLQKYRCTVLGDSSACVAGPKAMPDRVEVRILPGPYAAYLIHLGQSQEGAIESARHLGEKPLRRVVQVGARDLTPLQAYERYLGLFSPPRMIEQILDEAPVEAKEQRSTGGPAVSSLK